MTSLLPPRIVTEYDLDFIASGDRAMTSLLPARIAAPPDDDAASLESADTEPHVATSNTSDTHALATDVAPAAGAAPTAPAAPAAPPPAPAPSAPTPPAPAPPARPRRDGAAPPPASTPAPADRRRGHRPPKLALLLLAVMILGPIGWWIATTTPWTPPWMVPAGPLTASGTLEADEVLVGAEVNGRVVGLAQEGQSIQAGQVVAQLDDSLVRVQFRQADAATQQQLAIQADRYQLKSPISGVVTRVPVHTGEVAAAGQTVVAVADLNALEMTAYVLERDLGRVRVGQAVAVTADPFPGRTFYGVVTSTNQRAEFTPRNVQTQRDRLNLVFGVKIRVENPDGALKPGMPADATFVPLS
jgi:multidrug resistance efflux pump